MPHVERCIRVVQGFLPSARSFDEEQFAPAEVVLATRSRSNPIQEVAREERNRDVSRETSRRPRAKRQLIDFPLGERDENVRSPRDSDPSYRYSLLRRHDLTSLTVLHRAEANRWNVIARAECFTCNIR